MIVGDIFIQLGLILAVAIVVSIIMKILKQPLIIGYIITGVIVSPYLLDVVTEGEVISTFSHIGIALLLFVVGIHLNLRVIKEVGPTVLITGIIQIGLTTLGGYFISHLLLGFDSMTSLIIAVALSFSSTIIITKILSDKEDLGAVYGKITIGVLILQDLIAIFALMFVSGNLNISLISGSGFSLIIFGILSINALFLISILILPKLTSYMAKSQELLFLFSISWCFIIALGAYFLGAMIDPTGPLRQNASLIGALLAGISLSLSPYHLEISSKVRPLRDFFLIIFFIVLGMQIQLADLNAILKPALILSAFVIIGKFFMLLIPLGIQRYTKRTSFLSGITMGQISEFSLILIALAISLKIVAEEASSILTLTFLITTVFSTYMMIFSKKIYPLFSRPLSIFERKTGLRDKKTVRRPYHLALFGYNRIGFGIMDSFKKLRSSYVVVDFDPSVIENLENKNIPCIYGDADDIEFLNELELKSLKMIVSTMPSIDTNLLLVETIRQVNKEAIIIVIAHQIDDANKLYEKGASYVLMPHFLGGNFASALIEKNKLIKSGYANEKKKQLTELKRRTEAGHEHPKRESNR